MKEGKSTIKKVASEELMSEATTDDVRSYIMGGYEKISGGMFLLGLDMGCAAKSSNREEAVMWVRRNFGDQKFLMSLIDKGLEGKNKCLKCDKNNIPEAIYCSYCGGKLNSDTL